MFTLSRDYQFVGIALMVCMALSNTPCASAEFHTSTLMDDPWPEPAFARDVEVRLQPVLQFQVLGEEMLVALTMKNLSPGTVRLPHGWGNDYLSKVWIEVDREFAARHGIILCDGKNYNISAWVKRLPPGESARAIVNLDCYLTFTKPVRSSVPVTWRLTLRNGEEKSGHFLLNLQTPKDQLDEIMEQHRREQDRDLPGQIELPMLPSSDRDERSTAPTSP